MNYNPINAVQHHLYRIESHTMKAYAPTALLLILALGLSLVHAQDPAPQGKQDDVLTPLAIGNTWVYDNPDDGIRTTERIEGMVLFEGRPWYLLRTAERPIDEPDAQPEFVFESWIARIDSNEMLAIADLDEATGMLKLIEPSAEFKYPAAKGDTYRPIEADRFRTIEVTATDVPIQTQAGKFKCIAYTEHNADEEDVKITTYLAPAVGIVRYTITEGEETSTTDLIKYSFPE